jgi:hypothetical protein
VREERKGAEVDLKRVRASWAVTLVRASISQGEKRSKPRRKLRKYMKHSFLSL